MARATAVENTKIYGPNVAAEVVANSVTTAAFYVDSDELDERTVFIYTPGSANATLTVAAGTGYAGVKELVLDCKTSGKGYAFTLDSARYAIASGENVGLMKFTASAAGTFQIIQAKV